MTQTAQEYATTAVELRAYMAGLLSRIERVLAVVTQQHAAEALGVTMATVRYWKTGKTKIPIDKLYQLALIANTDPAWLILGENGKSGAIPPFPTLSTPEPDRPQDPLMRDTIKSFLDIIAREGLVITDPTKLANLMVMAYDASAKQRAEGGPQVHGIDMRALTKAIKLIAD